MISQVEVKTIASQPIATVRGESTMRGLQQNIKRLFDEYYAHPAPPPRGLNVIYYHGEAARDLFANGGSMAIECGTLMDSADRMDSAASAGVTGALPAGRVAAVTYWGSYEGMAEPHNALVEYAKQHGLERAGPFWEIYGHWDDDPAKLRTDVFHLLK